MPTRNQQHTIIYRAYNVLTGALVGSDVGNHTLLLSQDGAAGVSPTNSPTARATAGHYQLVVTASEADCEVLTLTGTSSTANVLLERVDVAYTLDPPRLTAARAGYIDLLNTGVALSTAYQATLVAAIESALINDGDGQALRDALLQTINSNLDLPALELQAIAEASRDAILNRLLAGNHDDAGSVGQLLQLLTGLTTLLDRLTTQRATNLDAIPNLLLDADYVEPDNDGITTLLTRTARVDALLEDSSGDRFTAKALEQGPAADTSGLAGDIADALGSQPVIYRSLIDMDGVIRIVRGDDYTTSNRKIPIDDPGTWSDLAGATIVFTAKRGAITISGTCELVDNNGSQRVLVSLPNSQTEVGDNVGWYDYDAEATLASDEIETLQMGRMHVATDLTRPA